MIHIRKAFELDIRIPFKLLLIFILSICLFKLGNIPNCFAANAPSNTIKLINKSFTQKSFKYVIPQISGMNNKEIQTLANNNIKNELISLVDPPFDNSSMSGGSEVSFQNNNLLSFHYEGLYIWPDNAHPMKIDEGINISLKSGKIYKLNDLFKGNNYKNELKTIIKSHKKQYRFKANETDCYNDFTYQDFIENFDDVQFVMHKNYLHLYYIGVYAVGTVAGYKIPYEDINKIINTNGRLWKEFKNINE